MKKWNLILPCIVLCVVVGIFIVKADELGTFVDTVRQASVIPFAIAFVCLFGRYFTHAFAYKAVFRCVDEEVKYLHIVPLVFSVTFANDCAPTAGMAGSALIATWAHKQGLNAGKSVTVVFLEKIGYFGGFAVVMLIGFAILIATGQMVWYLAAGGAVVILMIVTFAFVMWLGHAHLETEKRLFHWIERAVNCVMGMLHRDPMKPWADHMAASFHEASGIAVAKPKALVNMFARMVLLHASDCLCFVFSGLTFGFTNVPLLVASYVAGFIIATFVWQTIGAVEVLIGLILAAYGATLGEATAIAVCYRGLIFWVPFIIGAICINITGTQRSLLAKDADALLGQDAADAADAAAADGPSDCAAAGERCCGQARFAHASADEMAALEGSMGAVPHIVNDIESQSPAGETQDARDEE